MSSILLAKSQLIHAMYNSLLHITDKTSFYFNLHPHSPNIFCPNFLHSFLSLLLHGTYSSRFSSDLPPILPRFHIFSPSVSLHNFAIITEFAILISLPLLQEDLRMTSTSELDPLSRIDTVTISSLLLPCR